ncbi:sulfotransferase domain-containing protein [Patescibacteria group bacterium]|nr:sulfotransferase domain-containing protein [Patescibacteria group bacterium]
MNKYIDKAQRYLKRHKKSIAFSDTINILVKPLAPPYYPADGVIRVFGLPRSGNYWLSNLIADSLGINFDKDISFTHHKFIEAFRYSKIVRGVSIVRDVRDVITSLFHFTKKEKFRDRSVIYDDIESFYYEYFLKVFIKSPRFDPWEEYTATYASWGIPVIRYDKLWANTYIELKRLFQRWNIPVCSTAIEESVKKNHISNYKKGNFIKHFHMAQSSIQFGGSNYKRDFTPKMLKHCNERFGDYLRDWGFEV